MSIDIGALDPGRIVDLDLGSEETRQRILPELAPAWGRSEPFYVINNGVPQVVVGRHKDVVDAYTAAADRLSSTPIKAPGYERFDYFNGMENLAHLDGARHDRVRRLLQPSFNPAALKRIDADMVRVVDSMLDKVEDLGAFDFVADFANALIVRILLDCVLGMSAEQQRALEKLHDVLGLVAKIEAGKEHPAQYLDAQEGAVAAIREMIADRIAHPREGDFVSAMVESMGRPEGLDETEIIAQVFGILGGGQGTTAISAAVMAMNLDKRRDQFDQVIADRALVPQAVEESLRFQSTGFFSFGRFAVRDTEIGGVPVLEGMPVNCSMQAANYDPDVFADPLRFDIHRQHRNMQTFGAGRHHCLGNRLARRVLCIVLDRICVRFPNLHLQDPDFVPVYGGMYGELRPERVPMHTGK